MKPAWDKLTKEYEDHSTGLVAHVNCDGEGKPLCDGLHVEGFPSMRYGHPKMLKEYDGARTYDQLKLFAEANLGQSCSPVDVHLCADTQKTKILEYMAKPHDELLEKKDDIEETHRFLLGVIAYRRKKELDNLPKCGPKYISRCDSEQTYKLHQYLAMTADELEEKKRQLLTFPEVVPMMQEVVQWHKDQKRLCGPDDMDRCDLGQNTTIEAYKSLTKKNLTALKHDFVKAKAPSKDLLLLKKMIEWRKAKDAPKLPYGPFGSPLYPEMLH